MTILQIILILIVMFLGWPIGKLIASKTTEELQTGRKWFILICIISLILVFVGIFIFEGDELVLLESSFFFIFLISLASLTYKKNI